jgi:hypothetical protein
MAAMQEGDDSRDHAFKTMGDKIDALEVKLKTKGAEAVNVNLGGEVDTALSKRIDWIEKELSTSKTEQAKSSSQNLDQLQ